MDCLVRYIDFVLELSETCVKPEEGVNREPPFAEGDLRVSETRADLIVECTVAIRTAIPLKRSLAAALTVRSETAAETNDSVTSANLLQQVRCDRFRPKHNEWNHPCRTPLTRCPYPLRHYSESSSVSIISVRRTLLI